MKKVKEELKKNLTNKDNLLLAVSSGPDSMCLLSLIEELQKEIKYNFRVCYVNHQTRKSCIDEENFLKEYCKRHKIPLEIRKIKEYKKGYFTEEEARKKRYEFLFEIASNNKSTKILTAHHADDLMETMIMKIMRGSTLSGIIGLNKMTKVKDIVLYRPLLMVSKEEILNYLQENNIKYNIDETNFHDTHLRNRIRKKIVPELKKEMPNIHLKFLKMSEELIEVEDFVKRKLKEIEDNIKINDKTDILKFLKLDEFLQKEYLKKEFKNLYQDEVTKINKVELDKILKEIRKRKKKEIVLPNKYLFTIENGLFYITKAKKIEPFCIECEKKVILPNGGMLLKLSEYTHKSNNEIHLNSKQVKLPLYVTNRKPGMKMKVKNLNGSKKVKDILIDEKVLQSKKDSIPILIDANNTVLWVVGVKKSQYDLDKNENYDIIYKYEEKGK